MTKDDRIASYKYSVLQHARKHNNTNCLIKNLNEKVSMPHIKI